MFYFQVEKEDKIFDQDINEMNNLDEIESLGLGNGILKIGYGLGIVSNVYTDGSYSVKFENKRNQVYFNKKNIRYDRIGQNKTKACLLEEKINLKKVLLIGAYEDIENRKDRLLKLSEFLEDKLHDECFLYDHKGFIFFQPLTKKHNIYDIISKHKKEIENILHEDEESLVANDLNFETEILPLLRKSDGGGFYILNYNYSCKDLIKKLEK